LRIGDLDEVEQQSVGQGRNALADELIPPRPHLLIEPSVDDVVLPLAAELVARNPDPNRKEALGVSQRHAKAVWTLHAPPSLVPCMF